MTDSAPIYNSRITKTYLNYLENTYPDLDTDQVLEYAQITRNEVEDPVHWFSQKQTDRFQEIVVKLTGNIHIAREAGRFTASSEGMGPARQHILGFVDPASVYLLMERLYPILSRGATVTAKKLGSGRIEITSTPNPGINEKLYQCENRTGSFEALAKLFTNKFATVEHPSCFHQGDDSCRYIVSWEKTPAIFWKMIRNYSILSGILISALLFFIVPFSTWGLTSFSFAVLIMFFSLNATKIEKSELSKTIKTQGDAAKDLLDEMGIRHNNALLIQEMGQATSTILNTNRLLEAVINIMEKRLNFDRGLIMLANQDETRLTYKAGYGYQEDQEKLIKNTQFHLDNPSSKGMFVLAFKERRSFLVNDLSKTANTLSKRSLELSKQMGVQSLICVPIVYENESLGILSVDNIRTKRPHTQSDINLLMGVASQTAISIINARSFHKIQESEKKYRELVENASSIIMRRDTEGRIAFFNEFAQKFFGYDEKEILGKNISGTILPRTPSMNRELEKLLAAFKDDPERPITRESENILRSGEKVWIAWTYKPISDSSGQFKEILCIGNDISELKRAALEKRELELQLQRAQKMEAIGTLAGGVAHDLNNILSGIVSYPELLLMEIPEESPLRKPILTIQKSGERAASIVQDLLTLARRGVAVAEVVNLNNIISDYLKSPEHEKLMLLHPAIRLENFFEENLLNTLGSPVHLSKTIMNLVYNAAEAMPAGGKIVVSTQNVYIDKPINGYEAVKEGEYVVLTVSDTGIGIAAQDLERIFEPFYSKKVMGKSGTGLGMAVIWGTVKDHNGYIDVKSIENKGTTFTLYFSMTRRSRVDRKSRLSFEAYMGRGESLLVVDDVAEQRLIAQEMLKKLNYNVVAVPNGEEAVGYLKKHPVDLMLLDMIMGPGMDGLETFKKIVEFRPEQKAVIVSGFSESSRVKKVQALGAGAYVKKPYLLETLGHVIRKELDH